jgi:hypothetical protein
MVARLVKGGNIYPRVAHRILVAICKYHIRGQLNAVVSLAEATATLRARAVSYADECPGGQLPSALQEVHGTMRSFGISKLKRMPVTTGSPHSMQIGMKNADHFRRLQKYRCLEKYRHNAAARYDGM